MSFHGNARNFFYEIFAAQPRVICRTATHNVYFLWLCSERLPYKRFHCRNIVGFIENSLHGFRLLIYFFEHKMRVSVFFRIAFGVLEKHILWCFFVQIFVENIYFVFAYAHDVAFAGNKNFICFTAQCRYIGSQHIKAVSRTHY